MKEKEKKKTDLPTWAVLPSVRPILQPKPRAPIHVTDAWVPFVGSIFQDRNKSRPALSELRACRGKSIASLGMSSSFLVPIYRDPSFPLRQSIRDISSTSDREREPE